MTQEPCTCGHDKIFHRVNSGSCYDCVCLAYVAKENKPVCWNCGSSDLLTFQARGATDSGDTSTFTILR